MDLPIICSKHLSYTYLVQAVSFRLTQPTTISAHRRPGKSFRSVMAVIKMHSAEQTASCQWPLFITRRPAPALSRWLRAWILAGGLRFGMVLRCITISMAALTLPGGVSRAQQLCPIEGNASGRVVSVDERLDLTLEDGTRLKIAGIDPARPTPDNPDLDGRARENLANWLIGQSVKFRPLQPGQDRWGRVIAMVFAPLPGSARRSLTPALHAMNQPG